MPWMRSLLVAAALTAPALAAEPRGSDWPQWLGPKRDGSSPEKVKPWKGNKLEVAWKKAVPEGHSSPVVAGGKVYLFTFGKDKDKEEEAVWCFDASKGDEVWQKSYPREKFTSKWGFGKGPQATPAVADGKVYTFGATGVLSCFDADKGDKVWQVDTWKDFDVTRANKRWLAFGGSCSPLIDGDNVVVNVG